MPLLGVTAGEPIWRPPETFPVPGSVPSQSSIGYWFRGDYGAYADDAGTEFCHPGDRVARWENSGTFAENALQPTSARQPIYNTGGAGGRPYLECDRTLQQYFDDLALFDWASGTTTFSWQAMAAVIEVGDNGERIPILGYNHASTYTKADLYITETSGAIRAYKSQWNYGAVTPGAPHSFALSVPGSGCTINRAIDTTAASGDSDCTNAPSTASTATQFLRKGPAGLYFHGKIYELMVWTDAIATFTTTQINSIMSYLNDKYDIT